MTITLPGNPGSWQSNRYTGSPTNRVANVCETLRQLCREQGPTASVIVALQEVFSAEAVAFLANHLNRRDGAQAASGRVWRHITSREQLGNNAERAAFLWSGPPRPAAPQGLPPAPQISCLGCISGGGGADGGVDAVPAARGGPRVAPLHADPESSFQLLREVRGVGYANLLVLNVHLAATAAEARAELAALDSLAAAIRGPNARLLVRHWMCGRLRGRHPRGLLAVCGDFNCPAGRAVPVPLPEPVPVGAPPAAAATPVAAPPPGHKDGPRPAGAGAGAPGTAAAAAAHAAGRARGGPVCEAAGVVDHANPLSDGGAGLTAATAAPTAAAAGVGAGAGPGQQPYSGGGAGGEEGDGGGGGSGRPGARNAGKARGRKAGGGSGPRHGTGKGGKGGDGGADGGSARASAGNAVGATNADSWGEFLRHGWVNALAPPGTAGPPATNWRAKEHRALDAICLQRSHAGLVRACGVVPPPPYVDPREPGAYPNHLLCWVRLDLAPLQRAPGKLRPLLQPQAPLAEAGEGG
ncbi:hypothetical protein GPECTOR_165g161 [Gonium pectorale]|uniref:Endonuclease/exonuclease/phosphatase domain-containing protein n=1 Tax=Gonium pectorale TaxID=33097 RepID=A0A150FXF8_GONPE|nr:hypothetical protein GPECTOR_165g161 [Gonium pectorale]|eukprot:KXZ42301.1 hypothetical protein GPECTOR_165g161 [Gonium pectorale]